MRLAIVGSEGLNDVSSLSILIDKFIHHHASKNLTIVGETGGDVAREVEKFCYSRGFNFISLPFQKSTDTALFFNNVDRVLSFSLESDVVLRSLLRKLRKKGVPVMTITTNYDVLPIDD